MTTDRETEKEAVKIRDRAAFRPDWKKFFGGAVAVVILVLMGINAWSRGNVPLAVTALALIPVGLLVSALLHLRPRGKFLKTIEVDESGFSGKTFSGEQKRMDWDDTWSVSFISPSGKMDGVTVIEIDGPGRHMEIQDVFPKFREIVDCVRESCEKRGFDVVQRNPGYTEVTITYSKD